MARKRTSPIWQISREDLQTLVDNSDTMSQVMSHFGLKNKGGNSKTLHKRLEAEGIDYSKFSKNFGRGLLRPMRSLEDVLVQNSDYSRSTLKARLIRAGLIKNECAICGLPPYWHTATLVMVLDHVNGIPDDNRIENLRLLCPNCNSQTDTFAGRRNKIKLTCECGNSIHKTSNQCKSCQALKYRKTERPSKEELHKLLWSMPTSKISISYGVSDKAVEKWAKAYGLEKPPRGYWTKKT